MARILAYTTPGRGHLYPLIPILGELRRGHQVVLRTLAAEAASMRQRGFDAGPISDRIEAIAHDDWRAPSPRAALGRAKVHEAIQLREGARRIQHVFATAGGPSAAATRSRPTCCTGTTTEATVPTGPGIFSRFRRLGRRWR
jgi:UDP:flavonoid glycosyltransferase YjiC (YdhE family)